MDSLKKKRSSIKGSISRIEKYISELKTSDTVDLEQVKARLQKLETFFANFEETQDQIDEMEDDDTYRQEMEDKYFEIKSQCLALLNPERASMSIDPRQIIRREEVDAFSSILQSFTEQQATMNSLLRQLVLGSNTVSAQPPSSINTSVDGPGIQPGPSTQVEAPSSIMTQPIHSSISSANVGQSSVSTSTSTSIIFSSAANYTPASTAETFIPLTSVPLMTSSPVTIPAGTEFLNNNNCTLQGASTDLQLPKINIPVFYGQYEDWPAFHDLFSSLVHNSTKLSPSQKFQFLKSSLRGEAASLFKHLTISDANYLEAWNELNSRYNKEKYIIEAHLRNIMEQTSIQQQPSANALRKLCNSIKESVRALKALKLPTGSWDCWLIFIVVQKLDSETRQLWARRSSAETRPTFQSLMDFLDEREFELQSVQFNRKHSHKSNRSDAKQIYTVSINECVKCKGTHALYKCPEFLSLNVSLRKSFITKQALCQNCFRSGHQAKNCRFSSCRICHKRHHTLIHDSVSSTKSDSNNEPEQESITQSIQRPSMSLHLRSFSNNIVTILPTAIVLIDDCRHQPQPCRALLDSGSQATLITESCIQRLQLRRQHSRTPISGLGSKECQYSRGGVNITIKSRINSKSVQVMALILSKLSHLLPPYKINIQSLKDITNLNLADETFSDAGPIDLIIGSDIFFNILQDDRIALDSGLTAQNTIFGYIIGGKSTSEAAIGISSFHIQTDLDDLLQRFWELDELKINEPHLTEDEVLCENHYVSTHRRELDGRYVVQLPFKPQLISEKLGESRAAALRSLHMMEKRFDKDESFRQQYSTFMDEYLTLNHMRPVTEIEPHSDCYYIPHHAVIKDTSSTTKLRVVFNASKSTSTGLSLNEKLLIGPIIQHELVTILMRFRTHKIAYTADIAKMYRQIRMNDGDTKFQRILWRSANSQPVKAYELLTVTYGTSPAPFLATRTLKQLALDEGNEYPIGAEILQTDFYVDDTMSGSDTLEQAIECVSQIRQLLSRGGFTIRKWASNSEQLLEHIPEEHRELQSNLPLEENACIKTLGLNWNVKGDYFFFKVTSSERCSTSKRQILSEIAKIFDPLGWLAPCVVRIKLIIQRLWVAGISWDSELPPEILKEWEEFQKDFKVLESIRIPRWTPCFQLRLEYHTFADASEVAYAAVVYLRTVDSYNRTAVHLIASKTRVAPIKQVSLPRLELCAAHLATKLLIKVRDGLKFPQIESYGWTDSTIVLSWLSDIPKRWETFIANRSAEILSTLPRSKWRHVRSAQNAADCASRGLSPKGLLMHEIWWKGPKFLHQEPIKQDELINMPVTTLERRKKNVFHIINDSDGNQDLLMRYSSFTRLKRITALCLRFQHNATVEKESQRIYEPLSLRELQNALNIWIRRAQQDTFADELKLIRNKQSLPERNKLSSLAPFIDQCGILRIGGRLEEANIAFTRRHPAILPKAHPFTKLLLLDLHLRYFHAGQRLLTNLVLMNYWIPGYRNAVNRIIFSCVTCTRHRAEVQHQQMGNLPAVRVKPARPFQNTGIDYAGPIMVRSWKGRGGKTWKAYIALFVCLATKAYHLELVSSLATEEFIAALKRFTSRRGLSSNIYSDNGTTFVGANRQLRELGNLLKSKAHQERVIGFATDHEINWHFIPPSAPHFGGIWEAGVRAVKHHLRRQVGNALLTYEELTTLLCQIEAVLNSRPITQQSIGQDDYEALTPGHFLTGAPLTAVLEANQEQKSLNTLSRWQYVQRLHQSFWRRWQVEYLNQLQQRAKWKRPEKNLQPNDIVIIKEDNLPPTVWALGRVLQVHPGKDEKHIAKLVQLEDRILSKMDKMFSTVSSRISALEGIVNSLQRNLESTRNENIEIKESLQCLQRSSDILIRGIPEKNDENVNKLVQNICSVIDHQLSPYTSAFRLRPRSVQEGRHRKLDGPIIVKFSCPAERKAFFSSVWSRRGIILSDLEGFTANSKILFSESVSSATNALLRDAIKLRSEQKIFSTFTKDGIVHIRLKKEDRTLMVKNRDQLFSM